MRGDWLKIVFLYLDRNTELAHTDGASKENLHFDSQRKQVVFVFFSSRCFLKEIENMIVLHVSIEL